MNHAPRTPIHNAPTQELAVNSPNVPTPSQLTRFLSHAETVLGVGDASLYESPLRHKRYGLDILHKVADSVLEEIGIHPGDVIRLKDGASARRKGPDVKRKRNTLDEAPDAPPAKHTSTVGYERRLADGGGCRFSGPPMVGGDPPNVPGETLWYKCEARKEWFPIPPGYTVVEEDADDPFGFGA